MNNLVDAYRTVAMMNGWKWESTATGTPTVENYGGRIANGETSAKGENR